MQSIWMQPQTLVLLSDVSRFQQKLKSLSNLRPERLMRGSAPLKLNCLRYIFNRIIAHHQPKLFFNIMVASRYSMDIPFLAWFPKIGVPLSHPFEWDCPL